MKSKILKKIFARNNKMEINTEMSKKIIYILFNFGK